MSFPSRIPNLPNSPFLIQTGCIASFDKLDIHISVYQKIQLVESIPMVLRHYRMNLRWRKTYLVRLLSLWRFRWLRSCALPRTTTFALSSSHKHIHINLFFLIWPFLQPRELLIKFYQGIIILRKNAFLTKQQTSTIHNIHWSISIHQHQHVLLINIHDRMIICWKDTFVSTKIRNLTNSLHHWSISIHQQQHVLLIKHHGEIVILWKNILFSTKIPNLTNS